MIVFKISKTALIFLTVLTFINFSTVFAGEPTCLPRYNGDPQCEPPEDIRPSGYVNQYLPQECDYEFLVLESAKEDPQCKGGYFFATGSTGNYSFLRWRLDGKLNKLNRVRGKILKALSPLNDKARVPSKSFVAGKPHAISFGFGAFMEDELDQDFKPLCTGGEVCYVDSCLNDPDGKDCESKDVSGQHASFEEDTLEYVRKLKKKIKAKRTKVSAQQYRRINRNLKRGRVRVLAAIAVLPDKVGKATLCPADYGFEVSCDHDGVGF